MSGGLSKSLEPVSGALEQAGIAFMIAGSWASTYHGHPRTTQDVDIVIDPARDALLRFVASAEDVILSKLEWAKLMAKNSPWIAVALTLAACSPTALTAGGTAVKVGKMPPHEGCRELGIVMGTGGGAEYTNSEYKMASAQNEMRNRTATMGGDFVVLDASGSDLTSMTLSGRAFDCSSMPPPAPPVPVVVKSSGGEAPPPPSPQPPPPPAPAAAPTVEERLQKLEELYKKGLITDEERAKRRGEILQSI